MSYKAALTLLLTLVASRAYSVEFNSSVGVGLQYGGIVGWQGSIVNDSHRVRLGIGVIGLSAGYDIMINDRVSVGPQLFEFGFGHQGGGISLNYFPDSSFLSGWVFGVDLFKAKYYSSFDDTEHTENHLLVSIGYNGRLLYRF